MTAYILDNAIKHVLDESQNASYDSRYSLILRAAITESSIMQLDMLSDAAIVKLNAYPFGNVPQKWKQLHTDASIMQAIVFIRKGQYLDAIKTLDMAIIMSGAARQSPLVQDLIAHAQSLIPKKPPKRKRVDEFDTNSSQNHLDIPVISETHLEHPVISQIHLEHPVISYSTPPSVSQFNAKHGLLHVPCLISNSLKHWPTFADPPNSWADPLVLMRRVGPGRVVPVEIGGSYTSANWTQEIIPFEDFIERAFHRDDRIYLAQHNVFEQFPQLLQDVSPHPPYCSGEPLLNAWLGPSNTISPAHTDPYDNLLVQIKGSKYVRLFPPAETNKLYPYEDSLMTNTSQVDIEVADLTSFPKYKDAKYLEALIRPGDMLYIPKGWWHYVRSLEASMSVSFWW